MGDTIETGKVVKSLFKIRSRVIDFLYHVIKFFHSWRVLFRSGNMAFVRTTPTKKWLEGFNLGHLYKKFEENGFVTMASVQVMEDEDINTMFPTQGNQRLKLGERRLLEQQLQIVKKVCTIARELNTVSTQ